MPLQAVGDQDETVLKLGASYFLQLIPQVLLLTVFVFLMTDPPVSKQIAS